MHTINARSGMEICEENLSALVYSVGVLRGECREKRPMEQALASPERLPRGPLDVSDRLAASKRVYKKRLVARYLLCFSRKVLWLGFPSILRDQHPGTSGVQRLSNNNHVSDTANRNASFAWLWERKEKVVRFLQAMPTLYRAIYRSNWGPSSWEAGQSVPPKTLLHQTH